MTGTREGGPGAARAAGVMAAVALLAIAVGPGARRAGGQEVATGGAAGAESGAGSRETREAGVRPGAGANAGRGAPSGTAAGTVPGTVPGTRVGTPYGTPYGGSAGPAYGGGAGAGGAGGLAGRMRPVTDGDGRVHGAPVLPASNLELQPGQVQSINLKPRATMAAEFPYPVAAVHAGDADVLTASVVGAKLVLKATKDTVAETNMLVFLGDADFTSVAFRVRVDSTQPQVDIVRFTSPIAQHLNRAESEIAARLRADVDERVDVLATQRLQQALLLAGRVTRVNRERVVGRRGDQLGIRIETAQAFAGPDGQPRLYLRYRVLNGTIAPLRDLVTTVRVETRRRKWLFGEQVTTRELTEARDVRGVDVIPPGGAGLGLLILEQVELGRHESLSVEAIGFNGQRRVTVDRVLVGGG